MNPIRAIPTLLLLLAFAPAHATITGEAVAQWTLDNLPGEMRVTFTCVGTPTCTGSYRAQLHPPGCSNTLAVADRLVMTGMDVSRTGAFGGQLTLGGFDFHGTENPDGTCSMIRGTARDAVVPYNGYWNGSRGSFAFEWRDYTTRIYVEGTFFATSSSFPVFPMVVSASVDDKTARATAQLQFREQDIGSTGSVYVFALAPATLVKGASQVAIPIAAKAAGKDTAPQCVLAQLDPAGQLHSVSSSGLAASVTSTLTAQGQTVTVLDNVSTANVAGSTFYVGYGPDAATMYGTGINRAAVNVPGAETCHPEAPGTGWWWNSAEGGRGYSIEVQANKFFFAAFLYDVSGRASWYVSTGQSATLDGALIQGDLLEARGGQTLGGAYPGMPAITTVGPITLAFTDASHGTMVWPGGTVAIERFNIVPGGLDSWPQDNEPEEGWWWNPQEAGRGFFLEWQDGVLDIAGYMYDDSGNPIWYLTENTTPSTNLRQFSANWWQFADGMTLTGPWKPHRQVSDNVAPVTIQFDSRTTATMTLPNGRMTRLMRHRF